MFTRRLDLMVLTDEELLLMKSRLNTLRSVARESGADDYMLDQWTEMIADVINELLCREDERSVQPSDAA